MPARRRPQAHALAIALGLAAAGGGAGAQTSPWYLGASQTFGYDSNVFRFPNAVVDVGGTPVVFTPQSSGLISKTSLLGGLDIYPGRQHVYANASVDAIRYGDQPQLDSNGYGLTGGIDWETLERLSGTVRISANRRPGDYADPLTPSLLGKVLDEPLRADFIVRLGDYRQSRLWMEAGYYYTKTTTTVDCFALCPVLGIPAEGYEYRVPTNAVSLGARYRASGNLVLGAGLRHEAGDENYRIRVPGGAVPTRANTSYERSDIDFLATWTASGFSDIRARLSYTNTDYDQDPNSPLTRIDRSGPTMAVAWDWQATGKLRSVVSAAYDTSIREETDTFTSTNPAWNLGWNLTWATTAKITTTTSLQWVNRDLERTDIDDERLYANVGVAYQILRNVQLDCSVGREARRNVNVRRQYGTTLTSCSVQAFLR